MQFQIYYMHGEEINLSERFITSLDTLPISYIEFPIQWEVNNFTRSRCVFFETYCRVSVMNQCFGVFCFS